MVYMVYITRVLKVGTPRQNGATMMLFSSSSRYRALGREIISKRRLNNYNKNIEICVSVVQWERAEIVVYRPYAGTYHNLINSKIWKL